MKPGNMLVLLTGKTGKVYTCETYLQAGVTLASLIVFAIKQNRQAIDWNTDSPIKAVFVDCEDNTKSIDLS